MVGRDFGSHVGVQLHSQLFYSLPGREQLGRECAFGEYDCLLESGQFHMAGCHYRVVSGDIEPRVPADGGL